MIWWVYRCIIGGDAINIVKVGLIQINNAFSNSYYLPYSVGLLESYFKKYSKKADKFEFLEPIYCRMPIKDMVKKVENADIIAISAYAWNFNGSLEIAKRIKKKNENVLIIVGGPQIPDNAEKFLRRNPYVGK